MYSQGVARAVEQLHIEDKVLVTDVGSDILCSEWESGYGWQLGILLVHV